MHLEVIILAAGRGKRMCSAEAKVLHTVAGRSLLQHVYTAAAALNPARIHIIVGHAAEAVKSSLEAPVNWVEQTAQLGTGHAVLQALPMVSDDAQVLILPGDVPCLSEKTLTQFLATTRENASDKKSLLGILTATVSDPTGLGRMLRDAQGEFIKIVEEKDANAAERLVREINSGVFFVSASHLRHYLPQLSKNNCQSEYYLTDLAGLAKADGIQVQLVNNVSEAEIQGVNDTWQLAMVERYYQLRLIKQLMQETGLRLADPQRFDLRGNLTLGRGVYFDINVIIEGDVHIGDGCQIAANVSLHNVRIGHNVVIASHTVIQDAIIEDDAKIGPFARLRPGTHLGEAAQIGNFVEVKKSSFGKGSKASHLAYIGDTTIGQKVNIGAGTITCNYDGVHKSSTVIGDNAFVGSNCSLVAPLTVGEGATIAAGSTITKNAPADCLSVGRARQVTIDTWISPKKREQEKNKGEEK